MQVTCDPNITKPEVVREKLTSLGFPVQKGLEMAEQPRLWRNPKVITSVASGVLLALGWLLGVGGLTPPLTTGIFVVAILIGGYYFGREAIEEMVFEREVGIELLMSIAAIVATLMGEALEGALVVGAVVGAFSLPIAVLGHEISEFVVIGSGLRMLRS